MNPTDVWGLGELIRQLPSDQPSMSFMFDQAVPGRDS